MTPAAADIASAPVPATRAGLRDFSDRLSPMLVKELRQGLKSPVFVWGLIGMQLALAILAIVSMEVSASRDATLTFWWSVVAILCILLPMLVANALRDEMGGNTMDTLVLTQLSAWRITLGKWLATAALQILVAVTVLPYLILRYFAGGVNLPMELIFMGIFVVFGLLVTAVMLGLSWFRYFLIRAAVMLAIVFGAVMGCTGLLYMVVRVDRYAPGILALGWPGILWCLLAVAWIGFFFLDLGVAQIAPISENRATRRRLAVLLLFATGCAGALMVTERQAGMVLAGMLSVGIGIACIQALCERPAHFAPVLRPFVKRGVAGRLAGRFLYPGWHTGFYFTLLLWVASTGLMIWLYRIVLAARIARYGSATDQLPMLLCNFGGVLGGMILPLVVWWVCRVMPRWNFWRWLMVLICAGLVHAVIAIINDQTSWRVARVHLFLPSGGLLVPSIASTEVREEVRQEEEVKRKVYDAAEARAANEARQAGLRPVRRPPAAGSIPWEEIRRREGERVGELRIYAFVSLAVWLGMAWFMAVREMRMTRSAEDGLSWALAKDQGEEGVS